MAIAVAQQVSNPAAGSSLSVATGTTQTVSITPSAGSTLVVLTRGEGGSLTVTVSDPTNGSYTQLDSATAFSQYNWTTFIKQNVVGSTVTITATWSATNVNRGIIVLEITGATTSGGAQAHIVATGGNSTGNMTVGTAPALVIGFAAGAVGSSFTAGSGYTSGTVCWSSSGDSHLPENKRVTSTGSQAATFTGGGSSDVFFGVVLTEAAAGITLSGQTATAAGGTATPAVAPPLTGQVATVSLGTATPAVSAPLTGQAATSAGGTAAPSVKVALTGLAATVQQGNVSVPGQGAALSGQQVTAAGGTVAPGVTVALAGLAATVSRGTLTGATAPPLTGRSANTAGGTPAPQLTVTLTGKQASVAGGFVSLPLPPWPYKPPYTAVVDPAAMTVVVNPQQLTVVGDT